MKTRGRIFSICDTLRFYRYMVKWKIHRSLITNFSLFEQIRKPFNWEEDMKVSMVDTTRAKSMLDKTLLQSRFAPGKSQKYL